MYLINIPSIRESFKVMGLNSTIMLVYFSSLESEQHVLPSVMQL